MASWEEFSRIVAEAKASKKLDPVGQEDDDVDNDGDSDSSDSYLKKRRATVGAAIAADRKKKVSEALDPVGQEDKDIDNDGDHDKSDKYLLNRRKVRAKVIPPQERLKTDRDMFNIPKSEQEAARERILAKAKAKRMKEEVEQIDEIAPLAVGALAAGALAAPALAKKFLKPAADKALDNASKNPNRRLVTGGTVGDLNKARGISNSYQPEGEQIDEFLGIGRVVAAKSQNTDNINPGSRYTQVGTVQKIGNWKVPGSFRPGASESDVARHNRAASPQSQIKKSNQTDDQLLGKKPGGQVTVDITPDKKPKPTAAPKPAVAPVKKPTFAEKGREMRRQIDARNAATMQAINQSRGIYNSYQPEGEMVEEDKEYRREMRKAAARERAEEKKAETEFRSRGRRGEKKKGPKLSTTPITDRTAKSYVDKELGAIKYMERKTKGKHTVGNPFPENYDFGGEYIEEGGMSKDEMLSAIKGHKYSKKELLDMSKKSTKEGRHGEAAAFYHEFQKEANEIEEAKKSDYLNDKLPSDEKLGYGFSDNKKRVKDLKKLKRLVKHYDGMKKGDPMYNSYQPEGEIVDEGLFSINRSAPLRMGHGPRIKNAPAPIRSSQTPIKTSSSQVTSGPKITQTQNNSYQPEGEQLDEKALSRAQQRFMGMVYAAKKGDTPASPEVAKAASGMSKKAARDFAKTKHEGLPEKKEETKEEVSLVDKILEEVLNEAPKGTLPGGKSKAKKYRAVAKQAKLAAAVNKVMKGDFEPQSEPEPEEPTPTPKKKTEKERKQKAKEEVKSKNTATERAARTSAAGRVKAARIKREAEREKEAARTERQRERFAREDERKKQKGLEQREKERVKAEEDKKKAAKQRKQELRKEIGAAFSTPTKMGSGKKDTEDMSAAVSNVGNIVGGIAKTGVALGKYAWKKRQARKEEEKKKKEQDTQKEQFSNWREEFIFEVDDQSVKEPQQKVIDVSKKKNKIEINPNMSEENIQEIAPLIGILARVAGGAATRGIAARGAGFATRGALQKKAVDIAAQKGGEMTADMVQKKLEKRFKNEDEELEEGAAWTKKEGKSEAGGLNEKGRKSYERENPGSDLKAPSKKVGNPRRASFCARMSGMKAKLTSKKTANDPDSRINKSLRAWNC